MAMAAKNPSLPSPLLLNSRAYPSSSFGDNGREQKLSRVIINSNDLRPGAPGRAKGRTAGKLYF
jgi:hypothetical protein